MFAEKVQQPQSALQGRDVVRAFRPDRHEKSRTDRNESKNYLMKVDRLATPIGVRVAQTS